MLGFLAGFTIYVVGGLVTARVVATWQMAAVDAERRAAHNQNSYTSKRKPGDPLDDIERLDVLMWTGFAGSLWPLAILAVPVVYCFKKLVRWALPKNVFTTDEMKRRNEQDIEYLERKLRQARAKVREEARKLDLPWPKDE